MIKYIIYIYFFILFYNIYIFKRYKPEEIFISFNCGKDCTVVLHLAACITKLQNISSLLCLYVIAEPFPEVSLKIVRLKIIK